APVMTFPDGRKYKMLVAPLILDLDGRLNLNTAGNISISGNGSTHAGNQMLGPWEVNLTQVLDVDDMNAPVEWKNLFLGNPPTPPAKGTRVPPGVSGRYGPNGTVVTVGSRPALLGPAYAPVDNDGAVNAAPEIPGVPPAVGQPKTVAYQSFPFFPAGYFNLNNGVLSASHPSGYNALRPYPGNRLMPVQSMVSLLQAGGK